MHLLLDILQACGVAAAIGVRPFLPALLVGALASQDLGLDYGATHFAFLEAPWFLLILVVALVAATFLRGRLEAGAGQAALSGMAIGLAAVEFAGQLDDRFSVWWPGLIAGAALALLGARAASNLLGRVRSRLDAQAAGALFLYADAFAVLLAGLSVALPPVGLVGVAFLIFLLRGGQRRGGEKYAGLRILR